MEFIKKVSLKKKILKFIPPIIFEIYERIIGRSKSTYIDVFYTLDDLKKNLGQNSLYLNKDFDNKAALNFFEAIYNPVFFSRSSQRNGLLIELLLKLNFRNQNTNILDYGGANNPQFPHLSKDMQEKNRHFIVDRNELISLIKDNPKFVSLNKNIKLIVPEEFKNLDAKIDIAFFGSTVQYLEELFNIFKLLSSKGCKYIIISDSIFSDFTYDIYVKEINMRPSISPNKWHSRSLFLKNVISLGYKIIFECSNNHKYKHDSISDENFSNHSFILEKI